jgi:hypothetical protein
LIGQRRDSGIAVHTKEIDMQRRNFLAAPLAIATLWGCGALIPRAIAADAPKSARIAVSFSKMRTGGRPLWLDVDRMDPGDVSIQVDLWLRMDMDPPPAGGILVKPKIRIIEDSASGRRPILNSIELGGKSSPKSKEIHIVGTSDGLTHGDVFRPLGMEISIYQAFYFNPGQQAGATVSTIAGKDSFIIVTSN